ncbi:MAG: tRNA uridine-5-carboxymethylaminomethyl(34) synthesis GTPase MnmE [Solobacterium sp.]|nr:tRNA uridine-5-carboxymethylaminomethyl(34) synthesis GTPase MnmE [Solobacterium sp.]
MFQDTIAAIATGDTMSAISVIRISGEDALAIAGKLMKRDFSDVRGYTLKYGTIYDKDEPADEVLVSFFRAPRSYTGEDIVEINCHGGVYLTRKILRLVYGAGARPARPGEFTQRAFLNGKMDLSQAEGINDLIFARDEVNARSALHSLKGSVRDILEPLREELVQIIANIEVNIDYPEYEDVHVLTEEEIMPAVRKWQNDLHSLIQQAQDAVFIREGIDTVILGRPNVGKSSLLNALLEEDKAIVTDIAGTTRDIVEGTIRLDGVTLNLIDTAGIHETDDIVEKIGIERSLQALEKAELAIVVLDGSMELTDSDKDLLERTKDKTRIVVYNKKDLKEIPDAVSISAANKDVDALRKKILEIYDTQIIHARQDTLNNERQIGLALQAEEAMQDAHNALEEGMELDLVTIDLQRCYDALMEITGEYTKEGLLDEIFSRFCLGK